MPLRCGKLIYFIMVLCDGAVSHWAAKDATLSAQGHRKEHQEPAAGWVWAEHKLTDYFLTDPQYPQVELLNTDKLTSKGV